MRRSGHRFSAAALVVALLCAGAALAAHGQESLPPNDPIAEQMFPPELILRHQRAIGLSEAQKNALVAEVKRTQGHLIDVQWELQRVADPLFEMLGKDRPDEAQVLAQLDKVLAVERDVKRSQLALAVRLRNLLSAEQQKQLRELRMLPAPGAPGGRPLPALPSPPPPPAPPPSR